MNVRPLRCDIDTLEASMAGDIPEEVIGNLERLKSLAQGKEEPQPYVVGGIELFLLPRGRGKLPYVLVTDEYHLLLSTSSFPSMVKLLQRGLVRSGAGALMREIETVAAHFGLHLLNCTRIDVACDFQGWVPTFEEMRNVVCPAPFRPVYPNTERPETFQFGKGDIVVRVYDKTKEIAASHKEWWKVVWRTSRHFVKDEPVWRVEVQLRSEFLKQVECRSVHSALGNVHGLFEAGLEWCSVRVPSEDSNRSRWPVHPAWAHLLRTYRPGEPLGRVKPAVQLMDYDRQIKRLLSLVTTAAVTLETDDYERVSRLLYDDVEGYMAQEGLEFEQLVESKRRKRHL